MRGYRRLGQAGWAAVAHRERPTARPGAARPRPLSPADWGGDAFPVAWGCVCVAAQVATAVRRGAACGAGPIRTGGSRVAGVGGETSCRGLPPRDSREDDSGGAGGFGPCPRDCSGGRAVPRSERRRGLTSWFAAGGAGRTFPAGRAVTDGVGRVRVRGKALAGFGRDRVAKTSGGAAVGGWALGGWAAIARRDPVVARPDTGGPLLPRRTGGPVPVACRCVCFAGESPGGIGREGLRAGGPGATGVGLSALSEVEKVLFGAAGAGVRAPWCLPRREAPGRAAVVAASRGKGWSARGRLRLPQTRRSGGRGA
jgi:hypothetical protein